jgi:hypothetical protein
MIEEIKEGHPNREKLVNYITKKYSHLEKKPLIITEFESHYTVKVNPDESPMILGKSII